MAEHALLRDHSSTSTTQPKREPPATYSIRRRNRYWEVLDAAGELVCLAVYKRGATEVIRRLTDDQAVPSRVR
jgi:hypothetical protein